MSIFVGRNPRSAKAALADLAPGRSVHGLSDGSWSLIDALSELGRRYGPASLTVSTWTANGTDLTQAERLLRSGVFSDFRLLVDRSFLTRQPRYCRVAREIFGDGAIRVWSSHAKFVLVGGEIAYFTSANLNRNRRIEAFSAYHDADFVAEYLALVKDVFDAQAPGDGFDISTRGRETTEAVINGAK